MANGVLQGGLAELDRSTRDANTLLDHAANILRLDLDEIIHRCFEQNAVYNGPTLSSFREQWVLRWLLKKLNSDIETLQNSNTDSTEDSYVFNIRSWALLLHLIRIIPTQPCITILLERKYFQNLGRAIRLNLDRNHHERSLKSNEDANGVAISNAYDYPHKRRRISPKSDVQLTNGSSTIEHGFKVLLVLLQVSCQSAAILNLAQSPLEHHHASTSISWSSSVSDNASLLSSTLEIITSAIDEITEQKQELTVLKNIKQLMPIWATRPIPSSSQDEAEVHREFNTSCLQDSLYILKYSDDHEISELKEAGQALEKLVALHTVLPARSRYLQKHSKVRKLEQNNVTWDDIRDVFVDMAKIVYPRIDWSSPDETGQIPVRLREGLPKAFEVAIRLISKSDIRRRQSETGWLETFFITIVYMTNPRFPQMEATSKKSLALRDIAFPSDLIDLPVAFEELLATAVEQNCQLSIELLSYLSSAILHWDHLESPWKALSLVIEIDANVFVSNPGDPIADMSISQLLERIEHAIISQIEYKSLKNGIILPLLRSYARSRALKEFTEVWSQGLQEAIRAHAYVSTESSLLPAVIVWQDEDIFQEFRTQLRSNPSMNLERNLLESFLPDLRDVSSRIGPTTDIMAKLSIFSSCLQAWDATYAGVTSDQLDTLCHAVVNALVRRSDYHLQRWRLWDVIRLIATVDTKVHVPTKLFDVKSDDPTLGKLAEIEQSERSSLKAPWLMECFKGFNLIVFLSSHKRLDDEALLSAELQSLKQLISELFSHRSSYTLPEIWNGKSSDMDSVLKLVSACLGVLIMHPQILSMDLDLLNIIIAERLTTKSTLAAEDSSNSTLYPFQRLVDTTLRLEEMNESLDLKTRMHDLLFNNNESFTSGVAENMNKFLSLESMKRAQLNRVGEIVFSHLQDNRAQLNLADLTGCLTLLDLLSSKHIRVFAEPDGWKNWLGVLENIGYINLSIAPETLVCNHCISNITYSFWAHVMRPEHADRAVAQNITKWCAEEVKAEANLSVNIWHLLAVKCLISCVTSHASIAGSIMTEDEAQNLRHGFQVRLEKIFNAMLRSEEVFEIDLEVYFMLESLTDLEITVIQEETAKNIHRVKKTIQSSRPKTQDDNATDLHFKLEAMIDGLCDRLLMFSNERNSDEHLLHQLESLCSGSSELIAITTNQAMTILAWKADNFLKTIASSDCGETLWLISQEPLREKLGLQASFITAAVILQINEEQSSQHPDLVCELAKVASLALWNSSSTASGILIALENAKLVLDIHSGVVNQSTMDTLLCSLHAILSSQSTDLTFEGDQKPEHVYNRVCSVIGSVLARFRRRLLDRYHLLLPVLQQLVACLFYAGAKIIQTRQPFAQGSNPVAFHKTLPSWLRTSQHTLPPTSAQNLTRLLTSICNPTVSASRSSRKRMHSSNLVGRELTDETKKVRAIAGQHMQYLIMTYCRCTLDGQINPEVKDKLMPGLYSVLDSMGREVMRGMNAAMEPGGRAIFRTLYEDWVRYGKWDNS